MNPLVDFLAGRTNKLLRDLLGASLLVALGCVGAVGFIRSAADSYRMALQPMPPRLEAGRASGEGRITTVTRSVLDDPVFTGSTGGRSVVLDPCTGTEKR
jgi:hypothetical protein